MQKIRSGRTAALLVLQCFIKRDFATCHAAACTFFVFLVFRRACDGMVLFEFCRTQLAYLSLARLLARLETSQEWLVRGTR